MSFKDVGQAVQKTAHANAYAVQARDSVATGLAAALSAYDAASSSPNAFLVSELEKRDPLIRTPLTTVTWAKNIPVRTGGGWVDYLSNLTIDYASAGDLDDQNVSTNGATVAPAIQGNFGKDLYKTHIFVQPVSINEYDMMKQNITGRSLDRLLSDGVRLHYEKHMDKNVFLGFSKFGTTGLLNNTGVTATTVATNSGATSTTWANKTAAEILKDVNAALIYNWAASGYDYSAIPNHILIPFQQYNTLITRTVTDLANMSIMEYLKQNNIANQNGEELVFGCSLYNTGAGTGSTDRMVVYRSDERFVAVDELQPLTRMRTVYSARNSSFDTNYAANISEVEFFYTQTVSYWDGI